MTFENMNDTQQAPSIVTEVETELQAMKNRVETIFVTEDTEPKAEEAVQ